MSGKNALAILIGRGHPAKDDGETGDYESSPDGHDPLDEACKSFAEAVKDDDHEMMCKAFKAGVLAVIAEHEDEESADDERGEDDES